MCRSTTWPLTGHTWNMKFPYVEIAECLEVWRRPRRPTCVGGCHTIYLLSELRGVLFDIIARILRRVGLQTQPFGSEACFSQRWFVRLHRARFGAGLTNPCPRQRSSQKLPLRRVERYVAARHSHRIRNQAGASHRRHYSALFSWSTYQPINLSLFVGECLGDDALTDSPWKIARPKLVFFTDPA
jgi:hypothetical protein